MATSANMPLGAGHGSGQPILLAIRQIEVTLRLVTSRLAAIYHNTLVSYHHCQTIVSEHIVITPITLPHDEVSNTVLMTMETQTTAEYATTRQYTDTLSRAGHRWSATSLVSWQQSYQPGQYVTNGQ